MSELEESLAILNELSSKVTHPRRDRGSAPLPIVESVAGLSPVEVQIRKAEARYRTLVEQIPAVTFVAGLDQGMSELYVSPQIEALLGFSQREWLENPVLWYGQLHPEDKERWNVEFAELVSTGKHFKSVYRFIARDGHVVWVHGEAKVVRDEDGNPMFIHGVAFDITDIKRAEEEAKASLREKELLLKEIHHRVKNNLQITSSLLHLQSSKINDQEALEMFLASEQRVKAMALVHEKLYQSRDLARIDFKAYIGDLIASFQTSFARGSMNVTFQTEVAHEFLSIDTAVPCGLILNEIVSNAIKHAFPGSRRGAISIRFKAEPDGWFRLDIADNGVGVGKDWDPRKATSSLGMQLVTTLTRQLRGTLEIENNGGLAFHIRFPRPARAASAPTPPAK